MMAETIYSCPRAVNPLLPMSVVLNRFLKMTFLTFQKEFNYITTADLHRCGWANQESGDKSPPVKIMLNNSSIQRFAVTTNAQNTLHFQRGQMPPLTCPLLPMPVGTRGNRTTLNTIICHCGILMSLKCLTNCLLINSGALRLFKSHIHTIQISTQLNTWCKHVNQISSILEKMRKT